MSRATRLLLRTIARSDAPTPITTVRIEPFTPIKMPAFLSLQLAHAGREAFSISVCRGRGPRLDRLAIHCGTRPGFGQARSRRGRPGHGRRSAAHYPADAAIDSSIGEFRSAASLFDPRLDASFNRAREVQPLGGVDRLAATGAGLNVASLVNNLSTYGVGVGKQFRSGLSVSSQMEFNRVDVNVVNRPANRTRGAFLVTQPLARGQGADVVAATETAARIDMGVAELELAHVVSASVLETVNAYWTYVAATRMRSHSPRR